MSEFKIISKKSLLISMMGDILSFLGITLAVLLLTNYLFKTDIGFWMACLINLGIRILALFSEQN